MRCAQCLLDSVIGDERFGCHSAARRARFSFAARTWPFRGCKIFPSCLEFPYRVPGNRKWTEKIWTDISECYSKNAAKCNRQRRS